MRYLCSRQEMERIDKMTMEQFGIGSLVLMERAALAVYTELENRGKKSGSCLILAGAGNNGGDGLALARMLYEGGARVQVCLVGKHKKSAGCEAQLDILYRLIKEDGEGVPSSGQHTVAEPAAKRLSIIELVTKEDIQALSGGQYDVIVDSIFGIGLARNLVSPEREVIDAVNAMDGYKIAVDIASGLHGDTGCIMGTAFMADVTVTFGYVKLGMYLCDGPEVSGEIRVADIGFPASAARQAGICAVTYDREELGRLPERRKTSNKGTYGRVAVIAGCETMAGAAYFSAAAAYRSGAGLVKIYSHGANRDILLSRLPEAVYEAYPEEGQPKHVVDSAVMFADALVVGPGIGRSGMAEGIVKAALSQCEVPVVLDADGLNILSEHMEWLENSGTKLILTPHLKEMERLLGMGLSDIRANAMETVRSFAKDYHVVCVLKGANTIVADENETAYINTTGNNGMSTGGTGDVLTGVIAAFTAAGLECTEAARLGVMVHGMAGDWAAGCFGERGMIAGDMLEGIGKALHGIA